jgi:hypothetical protein
MATTPRELVKDATGWQTIVADLPEDYEALAKEHKVLEVQYGAAKITNAEDLLRLLLLHAGVGFSLRQSVTVVAEAGGPSVSHVTLHQKETLAAPYVGALVGALAKDSAEAQPERWAGYELALVDGTSFAAAGSDGTSARVHVQLRLTDLAVLAAVATDNSVGESFKRFSWRSGQLAIGDRGYANPPGIASVVEQHADVLVRVNRSALPMFAPSGERVELMTWLRSLKGYKPRERPVFIRSREHAQDVHGRLVAVRLPESAAEKARAWVRRELGSKATPLDFEAAHYIVLFTTVPSERMSTAMCLDLYRLRWQIELTFKRWKSLCDFDKLPNHRDDTILTWLNTKLLLALLLQRMASGASALFPPTQETSDVDALVLDAVDGGTHLVAGARCSAAAA